MRIRVAAGIVAATMMIIAVACGGGIFGKQYEYEEDLTIAMDGSATLVVNTSLPALAALRGVKVPLDPGARIDRDEIRALFGSPVAGVTRVSRPWRRKGRRFIQVRLDVPDIRRLPESPMFAWSQYQFGAGPQSGHHTFRQIVGPSAMKPGTLSKVGWDGSEIVAFRLHVPSRITFHNARDMTTDAPADINRGNILAWEQSLSDRLDGQPVTIEVTMESESILRQTLWIFGGAFAAAVVLLLGLIWWTVRRGRDQDAAIS